MEMLPKLLLAAACLVASAHYCRALVITGVCDSDMMCPAGKCCARWNPDSDVAVCKPLGQEGQLCHTASNVMPFPFSGARVFWRCPCGEGLTCQRSEGNIGHCRAATTVEADRKRDWTSDGPRQTSDGPRQTSDGPRLASDEPRQTFSPEVEEELLAWIEEEKALMNRGRD